jgi:hypothetical protein
VRSEGQNIVASRRSGLWAVVGNLWGPALAAILSLLAAVQALRLWEWRPGMPMGLGGDATFVTAQLGRLVGPAPLGEMGRLGAPFGQSPGWFPSDDQIHFLALKVIDLFADSPFTVGAVYFVLGFPASALTAYWLLRQLRCSRLASVVAAVLFSVLPGHQTKYEHLWLAGYWVVPLGLWLVFQVGRGLPLWRRVVVDQGRGRLARDLGFNLRTTLIVLCLAVGGVYYLGFTLILLGVVTLLRLARGERAFLLGLAPVLFGLGSIAGAAIVWSARGKGGDLVTGATPAQRAPGESEIFAGKFMDLVLPWYQHRADPLRFLTTAYNAGTEPTVEHPALGIVAVAGLVGLVWLALRRLGGDDSRLTPELSIVAVLTLVSLALYTKGGLGSFIALFGTAQLRTWSRLYIYLCLFGLIALGVWLTRLQKPGRQWRVAVLAGVVLVLGIADQTNPDVAPDYASMARRVQTTADFTAQLEKAVPEQCSVFQLPVVQFPESPAPGQMKDYDHLVPFLTSGTVRWSYGAMRGTAAGDWQLALPTDDPQALVADLAAAGFCAVEVDRAGYQAADDPTVALAAALGSPLAMSADDRLVAYDLRRVAAPTTAGGEDGSADRQWEVLHPVIASVHAYQPHEEGGQTVQWVGPRSSITVGNLTGRTVANVSLTVELLSTQASLWTPEIIAPDGARKQAEVPGWGTRIVTVTFDLKPGKTELSINSDIDAARTLIDGRLVSGKIRRVTINTPETGVRAAVAPRSIPTS